MMLRNWTLVSVFATLAVASWAQPPAAPPQQPPSAPPHVENAPDNPNIPQAVREKIKEQLEKRKAGTPNVPPRAKDQLVRPRQSDSAPVQTRPEQSKTPEVPDRPTTARKTPEVSTTLPRGPERDPGQNKSNRDNIKRSDNNIPVRRGNQPARPTAEQSKNETPKSTPITSNRATPHADATPFVPKDMPERLRRNSDKAIPTGKPAESPAEVKAETPSAAKSASDILPAPSTSTPVNKPATPPSAPPDSSSRPTPSKPPTAGKPTAPPSTPTPSKASPTPAAKTPTPAPPTPKPETPTPSPSPVTTLPAPGITGGPLPTPSTEAGRKAAERRKDRKVITVDKADKDTLNQAAEALLHGKPGAPPSGGKPPTNIKQPPKLTPWIAPAVVTGAKEAADKARRPGSPVVVLPPPGATPTPTPAPDTIRVTDPTNIINNIKNITLAPTPPPAPTPGATPVPTPPGVTPVPTNFRPKRDWVPYPGWRPQHNWKPPKGWTPPGGWNPPPGWNPPKEWVPRLRRWGWNYIPHRGWVVPVQWTPPPDFVTPPGWYYLPSSSYHDYGFYDPSEVVVLPGHARPDLQININLNQVYTPPAPPPVQVINLPPPPPRPAPPEPPRMPEQITNIETVAQILTRPRDPNGPRYQGPVLVTGSVHFDFDSYAIRPDSFPTLDAVGQALVTEMPDAIINVEGHTDSKGTDEYNQTLSEQRAWSVKSYLVQKFGLDPNRLIIVGYGERAPISENETDAGRALNRRVEFENVTDLYKAQVVETAQPQ